MAVNDTQPSVSETTRVFVSGLPPTFTSDQLASHFGSRFKVTDAHVLADRRIGFVGFVDAETAHHAARHFNKSYIRMSRIAVDIAKPLELSHHQHGQSIPLSKKRERLVVDVKSNKRKRASHDDGESLRGTENGQSQNSEQKPHLESNSLPEQHHEAEESSKTDLVVASDNDWLRGRTTRVLDLLDPEDLPAQKRGDEKENTQISTYQEGESSQDETKAATTAATASETVKVPNARLFIRNLAFSVTEADLQHHFSSFGKIQEIHLVKDAKTSSSRGTAFIQFSEPHEAESAMQRLDGMTFQGRILHLLPASDKRDKGLTDYDISQMPLKKQKAVRRKLDATKQSFSWNSLYMNPNAVVSSIADRLGVSKADILDPTSADAAVKQAHAETQIINETKKYLTSEGVNVDAFKHNDRDDRCLLLKNFPYGTTEAELRALLEPFGTVSRFLLPPAGTMVLMQFEEPYSASEALKHLSYKNFKGSVLYLEKAPKNILDSPKQIPQEPSDVRPPNTSTATSTVFVKNLNFSTTTTRLKEIAANLPGFVSARVKTRSDAKRPGQVLSMGFGFLEFRSREQAQSAVTTLTGHHLDGHELVAQLSSKTIDVGEETRKMDNQRKQSTNQTKIIIKNLPFQASKKDLRSLFAQYGELKMVRVPRKFDNSTRGFAFAEFVTPKEAENALEALANTHLLGRRLVLEFAEGDNVDPEEEIKAIERKVEKQSSRIHFNSLKGSGRRKFNLETARDEEMAA